MRQGTGIIVGFAAIALGCSSASSKPGAGTSNVQSFCMTILGLSADRAYACEGGSREAYDALIHALDFCDTSAAIIGASHVAFDADAAAACAADFANVDCWQNAYASPSCRKVFTGTVPQGGVCYPSLPMGAQECAAGTVCDMASNDCTSTCVAGTITPRPVTIGMACAGSSDCSGDNGVLTCAGPAGPISSGAGTCQAPAAAGPCNYASDCRSNRCTGATGATPGTCQAPKHVGDACTPAAGECAPGTYCGPASTCILLPAVGQPCAGDNGNATQCLDGACDLSGLCVPFGKKGDACQTGFIVDSCGLGVSECDATTSTCTPACAPGNGCGAPGQICCAGQRCNAGAVCTAGMCG